MKDHKAKGGVETQLLTNNKDTGMILPIREVLELNHRDGGEMTKKVIHQASILFALLRSPKYVSTVLSFRNTCQWKCIEH